MESWVTYTVVLYTNEYNIDKLINIRDEVLDNYNDLYSSRLFDINNKIINNEKIYYITLFGEKFANPNYKFIATKLNEYTKNYNVKWALELISRSEGDDLDEFYIFDDTKSLLDNNKVHIHITTHYDRYSYYVSNELELKRRVADYLKEEEIKDILSKLNFINRSRYTILGEDRRDRYIQIEFNSFEYIDNKYFYWNE